MSAADATLRCEGVHFAHRQQPLLRGVEFELRPGEVAGLLGRNGAGKTTLLRIVSGVLAPDAGHVQIAGRSLAQWSRRELAQRVAVVAQNLHVPFPFSVLELVLMGRAPHRPAFDFDSRADVARAHAALERLGIEMLVERSVFALSAGERQLVLLARALVQEPQILLLDEPTAFLDLRHRIDVLRVVRELASEGRSALVVSHDLGLAARACDRLLLLSQGVIEHEGPAAEVLRPDVLEQTFAIEADVIPGPDGAPLVIPRL